MSVAGSLRRGKETIGDLDILATGPGAPAALERFVQLPKVHEVLGHGGNKASVQIRTGRIAGGPARAARGELRRRDAVLHGQQGPQRHAAHACAEDSGLTLNEYGLVRMEDNARVCRRDRGGGLRETRARVDSAGTARELRRNRSGGGRTIAAAGRIVGYPRRHSHAHARNRRARDAGGDGRRGPRTRLRLHRDHRSFESAGHGERTRRERGLSPSRSRYAKSISDDLGIRILSGIECDILRDGAMDLAERRAGRTRFRDRQRAQPHESGGAPR